MAVQVGGDTGPGGIPEVETDVEAGWIEGEAEEALGPEDGGPEVGGFGLFELLEVADLPVGNREEVARIVGELVHHQVGVQPAVEEEDRPLVSGLWDAQEGVAPRVFLPASRLDVRHPPVGVQVLVLPTHPEISRCGGDGTILAEDGVTPGNLQSENSGLVSRAPMGEASPPRTMNTLAQQEAPIPLWIRQGAFLGMAMAGYLVYDQWHWWTSREDYSFGFLVPVFVAYVLHERWPTVRRYLVEGRWGDRPLREAPPRTRTARRLLGGVAWLAATGGVLLFFLGGFLQALTDNPLLPGGQAAAYGFAATVLGFAFLAGGRDPRHPVAVGDRLLFAGLFVFPALIWILSLPLLSFAEIRVSLFLLHQVTAVVFQVFDILGIPLEQRGNVLVLARGEVGVEDACSGIRSLTACLFAGSFLAAVFLDRWWKKVALVGCAMVFAFVMNIFRSLFLTAWAHAYGPEAIGGRVHDLTGYAVLGLTCVGLLLLLPVFNYRARWEDGGEDGPFDEVSLNPNGGRT